MRYQDFDAIPNGTKIFNHGYAECVAIANLWQEDVLGKPFVWVGSAKQWWTNYDLLPALHQVYRRTQKPVAGALAVWEASAANGWHGHIGKILEVYSDGSYLTLEQNYGVGAQRWAYRYIRRHNSTVLGYLEPYNNPNATAPVPPPAPQEEDEDMAKYIGVYIGGDKNTPAEKRSCAIYEPTSGFYTTWGGVNQAYTNEQSRIYGTANFTHVTSKHWAETILPQLLIQQAKGRSITAKVDVSIPDVGPVVGSH